jgi:IclR family acetate operon transcriptional repressor
MPLAKTDYTIASLDAALKVLETLAAGNGDWQGVTEICRKVGMTKNRVFRILSTLQARGYVEQDSATQAYRLGLELFHLGHRARSQLDVHQIAQPYLTHLAQATQEVAHLLVRRGLRAVCIAHRESDRRLLVSDRIGEPIPLHIGASPKILLAYLPPDERDAILNQLDFQSFTAKTITSPDQFRRELESIAAAGYTVDQGDYEDDVCAAGAPVFDQSGQVIAGVSVTLPITRYNEEMETFIVEEVVRTARMISQEMGYIG